MSDKTIRLDRAAGDPSHRDRRPGKAAGQRSRRVFGTHTWESKYHGDWHFDVANGAFQGDGGEALVFEVIPAKVLAFAKGDFAQTRYRFRSR